MTSSKWLTIKLDDEINMGQLENVRQLLQQGADVNCRNAMGDTPLKAAAYTGQADMVRLLLEFGADSTAKDFIWNRTASQWAHELGHEGVIWVFAEWEEPRDEVPPGQAPGYHRSSVAASVVVNRNRRLAASGFCPCCWM